LRKEIQKEKIEKGKGGASRPRPHFWPARRSRPSPPALSPSPRPRSRPRRVHARTAAPRRRGEPAELGCRVASMRSPGRALVGHQERPAAPASALAAVCARQLSLSRTLALAPRAQSAAVAIGARAPPPPFSPSACAILRFILPRAPPSLRRCGTHV